MTATTIKMTARQYLQLDEDSAGTRRELVDGELIVSPSPVPEHSLAVVKLAALLATYVEAQNLGLVLADVDTAFGHYDVRRPDILYFSAARSYLVGPKSIEGSPDLCIEVVSPGSSRTDRVVKFQQYAAAGVANYWIIDPAVKTAEAYVLTDAQYVLAGHGQGEEIFQFPPFAKLSIPLGKLWWQSK